MSAYFLLLVCLLPAFVFAQGKQFPDSIRVELPEQGGIVIFELRSYTKDKETVRDFPSRLSEVISHIKKSIPESQWKDRHTVVVTPDKSDEEKKIAQVMITRENDEVTRLRVEGNNALELLPPGWEIRIRSERSLINVYVPDLAGLEAISKVNFEPVLSYLATQEEFVNEQRMGVFTRLVLQNEQIKPAGKSGHRFVSDMLGLHPGAGVGIVGDKFYPEFNFLTAIYLGNRYMENRQRIAAGYELKLFSGRTEENAIDLKPASFVTLSYGINFRSGRPRWAALGVGYMVHNRSDLFTGKTMKLFLETDIGSDKLNIVPELYLTDDFKKSVFGLKLNYKF